LKKYGFSKVQTKLEPVYGYKKRTLHTSAMIEVEGFLHANNFTGL
jgi:hypothetical protein